ncbi:uncharacterized protein LOC143254967 [Tachypleus tridentatus]|uniref:uncharacterized protein LOC143254967 n=1 Tax=Tachypleus tridentatus TaxID=6853 RepID=UPI003FD4859A
MGRWKTIYNQLVVCSTLWCLVSSEVRPIEQDSRLKYNTQFSCSRSGYFRDPLNCNKFYRCVDFNGDGIRFAMFQFDCPEGLVFDEGGILCNWPSAAPPCQDVRIWDPYPIEEDSSDEKEAEPQPIPITDGDESPVSDSDSTQDDASSPSDGDPTQDSDSSPSGGDPIQDISLPTDISKQESTSASEDNDGLSSPDDGNSTKDTINVVCFKAGYFRHPTNCSKFYRCVNTSLEGPPYYTYIFECPKDLWFDETIESCNWKALSPSCNSNAEGQQNGDSVVDSTISGKPEAGASSYSYILKHADNNNDQSEIMLSPRNPDVSELICTHEGFFRNPTDCGKFYGCADLTGSNMTFNVVQYDCPDGSVFDETTCSCKLPQFAPPCTNSASESAIVDTLTNVSQPKEDSNKQCETTGYFRDPQNCHKFYRCVNQSSIGSKFVVYEFECTDGLVFDEIIHSCNWPHKAPPCNDSSSSKTIPDDSEQKIPDSEDEKQQQGPEQGDQTSVNESSNDKDSSQKDNVEADSGSSTEDKSGQDESGQSESSSSMSVESNNIPGSETSGSDGVTSASQKINNNQLVCLKSGLFRHPDNCSKFYMCHNLTDVEEPFAIYVFDCPNDLVFDENTKTCNWPNQTLPCNNQSGASNAEDVFDSTSSYEITTLVDQVESGVRNSSQTGSQSGATDAQQGEIDTNTEAEESLQGESDSQPEGPESPPQQEGSAQNKEDEHLGGSSECKEVGFFRNPSDCNRFYRCVKQGERLIKYEFQCPDRLVFDENFSVCTWASQAPPCRSETSQSGNESLPGGTTSESGPSTLSGSPTEDVSTEGGSTTEGESSSKNSSSGTESPTTGASTENDTLIDGDTSSGTTAVESGNETLGSTTTLSPPAPPEETTESSLPETGGTPSQGGNALCPKAGFFRNPRDCHKFYRCVDFEENSESFVIFEFDCPDGLVFDERVSVCNWPNQAPPCNVCPPVDGAENSTNGTQVEETTLPMSTTTELTETTTKNVITVDVGSLYDCQIPGNFPFESDCIRFYRCVEKESGLIGLLYRCPSGYIFDEKVALCRRKPADFICSKTSPNSLIFRADPFILDNAILATSEFLLD